MKKISVKKFGIIISSLIMLVSSAPFIISELYQEQLPSRIEKFFVFTFLLAFIMLALALIMRDHRETGERYNRY